MLENYFKFLLINYFRNLQPFSSLLTIKLHCKRLCSKHINKLHTKIYINFFYILKCFMITYISNIGHQRSRPTNEPSIDPGRADKRGLPTQNKSHAAYAQRFKILKDFHRKHLQYKKLSNGGPAG